MENKHRTSKKTSDSSKIKSSNKNGKHMKTAVTHKVLEHNMVPFSGVSNHDLPPQDKLREEARIQLEVQNRLSRTGKTR